MLEGRYGNRVSTSSECARDAYVAGVDALIAANPGVEEAFQTAIDADDGFALAHLGLARFYQSMGRVKEAASPLARARDLAASVTPQEAAQIEALGLMIEGKGALAYPKIRAHVLDHPRDVMMAQTCAGVFGLIGFSGKAGREAEQLAYMTALAPHYGDDWWFLSQFAFAQMEAGQISPAADTIERALASNPKAANSAHVRAHLYYENGESKEGYRYLADFWADYDRSAQLHCHISWHLALWALERGDIGEMWRVFDNNIEPGVGSGPPINILTDSAAILYRAGLKGIEVSPERWQKVSAFAAQCFPEPGIAFADVHAAVAHAMAGNSEALEKIIRDARGPAGDIVSRLAEAFGKIVVESWKEAANAFASVIAEHERIGGSRAQRDLIDYAMTGALLKDGQIGEARRYLAIRRPHTSTTNAVTGLG